MKPIVRKSLIISGAVFLVAVSFCAGLYVNAQGGNFSFRLESANSSDKLESVDLTSFWKVWDIIDSKYVDGVTASSTINTDKMYGAIKGLVASLNDPYSEFFTPTENKQFNDELSGSLEGVGMTVGVRNKLLTVISPIKGSPSDRAGVLPGDIILKIDDKDALTLNIDEAIKLIRGKKGTTVNLSLGREGRTEPLSVSIVRDVISIPTIDIKRLPNGVFMISLYEFNASSASLFRNAMKEFYASGSNKLILDLRNNPGGFLDSAVDISSWFIGSGKTIVTEDYGNKREPVVHRSKGYNVFSPNMKMVVLINGGSASASEIVAGALSEYGVATLVGEKSFGKGSVQELLPVTGDTSIKITVAKWLTPKGKSISKEGLFPDFEVKMTEDDILKGLDPQLEKAKEIINR